VPVATESRREAHGVRSCKKAFAFAGPGHIDWSPCIESIRSSGDELLFSERIAVEPRIRRVAPGPVAGQPGVLANAARDWAPARRHPQQTNVGESSTLKSRYAALIDWGLPIVCLIGLTLPFWTTDLDVDVVSRFYTPGVGWTHGGEQPWAFLYHYGWIPAWIVAIASLAIFVASFWKASLHSLRRPAIFLVLVMIVGNGLIVNVVFKQNWGRPRPRDLVEFDGDRGFVKAWVKSPPENGNSFVSGHAATGFYLLAPFFLLRRRSKRWAFVFVAIGLAYGSIMGLARITQGAHFPSDVLWSLGLIYLTGLALLYLLHPDRDTRSP
jgi:lipid A 4'-phosphatase